MGELPPAILERLRQAPKGLRDHAERVRAVARDLAERHGVDLAPVDLGAAAHDLARAMKGDALLEEARRHGLDVHPVEESNPLLLHGAVAAQSLERTDGVADHRVLEAVRWHSTGRRGMGPVAKVVFLADKLDPHKLELYPERNEVKALAYDSLDRAIVAFLERELTYHLREGNLVHPESLELRNELIIALR